MPADFFPYQPLGEAERLKGGQNSLLCYLGGLVTGGTAEHHSWHWHNCRSTLQFTESSSIKVVRLRKLVRCFCENFFHERTHLMSHLTVFWRCEDAFKNFKLDDWNNLKLKTSHSINYWKQYKIHSKSNIPIRKIYFHIFYVV